MAVSFVSIEKRFFSFDFSDFGGYYFLAVFEPRYGFPVNLKCVDLEASGAQFFFLFGGYF